MISKQKEIFTKLADERLEKIAKLDKKVNLDNLIYRYKAKTPHENFDTYDNALDLIDKIRNGKIRLADVKYDQMRFKSNLGEIKKGPKKLQEQKINALYNIEMLCKARNEAIKFYDEYSLMVSEAKNQAKIQTTGTEFII